MAAAAGQSPRDFHRRFVTPVGTTLARAVERLRAEIAYSLLGSAGGRVGDVAFRCGFESKVSMRRAVDRWLAR
ncbi:helix-turn-helix domain-containing protein [Teichococcus vastitatis]|jgi:transcriptional regulator GlxA family with amidase domain|uniref:helix-turn-helix domain-containing protein n=1 Tax=Teichococcus vastitatis TaxID=2307076 RepID=UPI0034627296